MTCDTQLTTDWFKLQRNKISEIKQKNDISVVNDLFITFA